MTRLPAPIAEALQTLTSSEAAPQDIVLAVSSILELERGFEGLGRAVEAFREASRSLGILEESRSGQRLADSWAKLSRFFLAPLKGGHAVVSRRGSILAEAPPGREVLAARWERLVPEVEAFLAEEKAIDRGFAESSVSAHVSFKFRSRLLLLDRRAERIKVGIDLVRSDLAAAARQGLARLAVLLGSKPPHGARTEGAPSGSGGGG
ncbi:MAG TPA: hypothetical protein VMT52_10885 [Planctomycetota bacterium]|nr:hypothetical protein [Planctomycetota bacterium]